MVIGKEIVGIRVLLVELKEVAAVGAAGFVAVEDCVSVKTVSKVSKAAIIF